MRLRPGFAGRRLFSVRSVERTRGSLAALREETMRTGLALLVLIFGVSLTGVCARTRQPYQSATVVSVANHETRSNYVGDPSDAPLQPQVYSYDIGIQLNCTMYVVRYDTGFDYLPSVFSPHQTVQVSVEKHVMNVNIPGAREVKLSIGSRSPVKDTSCMVNN